jgi:hypothetical protein
VRHFGLEEATRLVPLLKETFDAVRPLAEQISELTEDDPTARPLLEKVQRKLQPLIDMGIEIKSVDGLVDFRALREGRTVYLCWRYGEDGIGFWHDLESGFAGRRPIRSPDEFEPTYLS